MASFSHVKDAIDDFIMRYPVASGLIKLLLVAAFLLNFLGGIW